MMEPEEPKPIHLRSERRLILSEDEVKEMLKIYNFFHKDWNLFGRGVQHAYELKDFKYAQVVIDRTTGLMWQRSGSEKYIFAEDCIKELNNNKFAGFSDWRLPTLEEAMSLMEPPKQNQDLFIDPIFDKTQHNIWTSDLYSFDLAWYVSFFGYCHYYPRIRLVPAHDFYVRAVRSNILQNATRYTDFRPLHRLRCLVRQFLRRLLP